jgi:hypothetical protein
MAKQKDGTTRATYSVRLNPDLLRALKHIAVDEDKSVGELIEEGIKAIIKKRKATTTTAYTLHDKEAISKETISKDDSVDIDSDSYQIPKFLRKRPGA